MKKFTLIELVVVVAIMGILMTLLVPSLKASRQQGIAAVCLSNMMQIARTAHIYETQYKFFPKEFNKVEWNFDEFVAQDSGMWECPADVGSWSYTMNGDTPMNKHGRTTYEHTGSSYFWNEYATSRLYNKHGVSTTRLRNNDMTLRRVMEPEKYLLSSCAAIRGPYGVASGVTFDHLWHFPGETRWPVSFADGHAACVRDSRATTKTLFNGNAANLPFVIKQDDNLINIP
ncbi:MAG: type II secretion system GspH family protein [Lentisphaerales bacterium]|nr:type II secretion system GspH family protein [Lentisphaerales bacterium]